MEEMMTHLYAFKKFAMHAVTLEVIIKDWIGPYLDWNSLVQSECVIFSIESHRQWV